MHCDLQEQLLVEMKAVGGWDLVSVQAEWDESLYYHTAIMSSSCLYLEMNGWTM